MVGSPQKTLSDADGNIFSSDSRVSWTASKLVQSLGIEAVRLDAVHEAMILCILTGNTAQQFEPENEAAYLAAQIVAVARIAEQAAMTGGVNAAVAAVMRASGTSIDPLLAQNFLRLASSSIFWMALDSASTSLPFKYG